MRIEKGKSYLLQVNRKLVEVKIEDISPAANFLVNPKIGHNHWLTFWEIYGMVVEAL